MDIRTSINGSNQLELGFSQNMDAIISILEEKLVENIDPTWKGIILPLLEHYKK
ncbi:3591_t:CDS:2 [Acaulospora morrowiae]|uniref:3591_t:CDS:1 n=1 Tax=Acaulospora morrowiae TaxID=94023 RepID=A0A9N9EM14_9GLOM|nr:3591_t:CDS:2 [Acaulospora morrowiae]